MKSKIVFGSVLILCYFIALQLISHFDLKAVMIGVLGELLTIPALIVIPVLLFISFKNWKNEGWKVNSMYVVSILLLIATIASLFF
ncbi:MAG: hypothetical protein COB12_04855 [Flavobacterium sp.]|nr:MAG: hypothetical protein COB12_04855 [Flavobacterium sp.]